METPKQTSKSLRVKRYEQSDRRHDHGTKGNTNHFMRDLKRYEHSVHPSIDAKSAVSNEIQQWLEQLSDSDREFVLTGNQLTAETLESAYRENEERDQSEPDQPDEDAGAGFESTPLHLDPATKNEIESTLLSRRKHLARAATLDSEIFQDDTHDYSDGLSVRSRP